MDSDSHFVDAQKGNSQKQNKLSLTLRITRHNLRSGEFMDQMPYNSEGNEEQTIVSMNFASSSVFVTCARHFPILRDLEDCETLAKESGEEILK